MGPHALDEVCQLFCAGVGMLTPRTIEYSKPTRRPVVSSIAAHRLHEHLHRVADLDEAVRTICADPDCGELKVGDLAGIQVYKFKMVKQLTLLAYTLRRPNHNPYLLALGSHENFYRDLKRG